MPTFIKAFVLSCLSVLSVANLQADDPREQIVAALDKAISFYQQNCSKFGGYDYRYSIDFSLTEGEGETDKNTIWVQPPGTPAVGLAMLEAYDATGNETYLKWAEDAGMALVNGQLQSGGWYYSISFDPEVRTKWGYRDNPAFRPSKTKKNKTNVTTLDDDTTPAAIRLLAQVDKRLKFKNKAIHDAAIFALNAMVVAQYPNGGWTQRWDTYPSVKTEAEFPVIPASYPETWSRKWLNDWPGVYYTNDNVAGNMIKTMLLAWEVYGDERYRKSAEKTGDFFLLAQLPEPQPAWAQQYDPQMHPCWDRKFEPPAISGGESQMAIESLMLLYHKTGEARFLQPIDKALTYLKQQEMPDKLIPRFLELKTDKPLYFNTNYQLTYDASDLPTHYGFIQESKLTRLSEAFEKVKKDQTNFQRRSKASSLIDKAMAATESLDSQGAWVSKRGMQGHNKASQEGVYESEVFNKNIHAMCEYLQAIRE